MKNTSVVMYACHKNVPAIIRNNAIGIETIYYNNGMSSEVVGDEFIPDEECYVFSFEHEDASISGESMGRSFYQTYEDDYYVPKRLIEIETERNDAYYSDAKKDCLGVVRNSDKKYHGIGMDYIIGIKKVDKAKKAFQSAETKKYKRFFKI